MELPQAQLIEAATKSLGAKKGEQKLHMRIEPTDNDAFIVHHDMHEDGMPTGRIPKHALSSLSALIDHVKKHYMKDPALEEAEQKAEESKGGKEKDVNKAEG